MGSLILDVGSKARLTVDGDTPTAFAIVTIVLLRFFSDISVPFRGDRCPVVHVREIDKSIACMYGHFCAKIAQTFVQTLV